MGVSASGLAHRTVKRVIQALACWNHTRSMLYTICPEKSGYGHEWVNPSVSNERWKYTESTHVLVQVTMKNVNNETEVTNT